MITDDVRREFDEAISVRLDRRDQNLRFKFNNVVDAAARVGALGGSRVLLQFLTVATDELEPRLLEVIGEIFSSLEAHEIVLDELGIMNAEPGICYHLDQARFRVGDILFDMPQFKIGPFGSPNYSATEALRAQYNKASGDAYRIAKLNVDRRFAVMKQGKKPQLQFQITQNFNGAVGAVISGDDSTVHITQTFSAENLSGVVTALTLVVERLSALNAQREEISELIEIANDAKAEAQKLQPNKIKLVSALQGVGAGLSLIKKVGDAYLVLKSAAAMLGVHLP